MTGFLAKRICFLKTKSYQKKMSVIEKIKEHEGFRDRVYKCSEGFDTIGYGFAIKDLVLDEDIAEMILERKQKKLTDAIRSKIDWFDDSPKKVQDVITNMCYQIGLSGFLKFKKTFYYLETEQYQEASEEMLDSLWARQTPNRAKELSKIIRSLNGHSQ